MELKGGDQADDPFGYQLRNLGEVMGCRYLGIGELVEATGDAGEGLVLEHTREGFRVYPGVAELDATHGATGLEQGDSPIFLRCRERGGHVSDRRSIGWIVRHCITPRCGWTENGAHLDWSVPIR